MKMDFHKPVLLCIFANLDLVDMPAVKMVCRRWHDVAESDVCWWSQLDKLAAQRLAVLGVPNCYRRFFPQFKLSWRDRVKTIRSMCIRGNMLYEEYRCLSARYSVHDGLLVWAKMGEYNIMLRNGKHVFKGKMVRNGVWISTGTYYYNDCACVGIFAGINRHPVVPSITVYANKVVWGGRITVSGDSVIIQDTTVGFWRRGGDVFRGVGIWPELVGTRVSGSTRTCGKFLGFAPHQQALAAGLFLSGGPGGRCWVFLATGEAVSFDYRNGVVHFHY